MTIEGELSENRVMRLGLARRLATEKKVISDIAKRVADKLNQQIALGHETTAFLIAVSIAILKDLLDILQLGIPLLGPFLSLILFYFLWGKGWFLSTRVKLIWWILGFFIDNLPFISVLPINTIIVLWAWRIVSKKAKKAENKLENLPIITERELQRLDENIDELDKED